MAQMITIDFKNGNSTTCEVVAGYQNGENRYLITYNSETKAPEGLVSLGVSYDRNGQIAPVELGTNPVWDFVTSTMRDRITTNANGAVKAYTDDELNQYYDVQPGNYTFNEDGNYARFIAVMPDQKDSLSRDYQNALAKRVENVQQVVPVQPEVMNEPQPVAPVNVFEQSPQPVITPAPEMTNPVSVEVPVGPVTDATRQVVEITSPIINDTPAVNAPSVSNEVPSSLTSSWPEMKADIMRQFEASLEAAFQEGLNRINELERQAKETLENAKAKEEVALHAFNNSQNLNNNVGSDNVIAFPTPDSAQGPVLTKNNQAA